MQRSTTVSRSTLHPFRHVRLLCVALIVPGGSVIPTSIILSHFIKPGYSNTPLRRLVRLSAAEEKMLLGQLVSGGERERDSSRSETSRRSGRRLSEICTSSACEVVAHAACPFQSDAADGQEREGGGGDGLPRHAPNYL